MGAQKNVEKLGLPICKAALGEKSKNYSSVNVWPPLTVVKYFRKKDSFIGSLKRPSGR